MKACSIEDKFVFDVQGYLHLRGFMDAADLTQAIKWVNEVEKIDIAALNEDFPAGIKTQLNRPVSRILDADSRFAHFLDHPAIVPYLVEFLGQDYRHIDNDLLFTYPGYGGGPWHRGVRAHPTGHYKDGRFFCPMVKAFYCLTDVGPGEGEFVLVPGSHRTSIEIPMAKLGMDLPAQHVFDDVRAGDVILFNEALLHNGRPNPSSKTRKTIIMNFGRVDAGPWPGYTPTAKTLSLVTPHQRSILTNSAPVWIEPVFS